MKKLLVAFILYAGFFTSAQEVFPDAECRKAYESILNKDWNGFDGKGNKIPPVKLIHKGVVDFPYFDSNEGKKKYLKKIVEIYKYEPVVEIDFVIPVNRMDFSVSPEMAYLSYLSDYKNRTAENWEELKKYVIEEKRKPLISMYYKVCVKADDGEIVAIIDLPDWPTIMFKPSNSDNWKLIKSISFQENLLFYVVHDNLYLGEVDGSLNERIETKLKTIMSNRLTLPPDIEERLVREEAELKAKLSGKTSEAMEIQPTPEEIRMEKAIDQILKNVKEGKDDPPEIKEILGDKYGTFREDAEEQVKRIKEKEKIMLDLTDEGAE